MEGVEQATQQMKISKCTDVLYMLLSFLYLAGTSLHTLVITVADHWVC